jgi:PAS domain S-box-containing protein
MSSKKSSSDFFLPSISSDILDTLSFGIYVIDANGIIEYFNPAMIKIAGAQSFKDVKGLNVLTLENYKKSGLTKYFIQGLAGISFEIDAIKYTSASGKKTTYRRYYGIPIKNSSGTVEKLLCIVEDVTKNFLLDETLKKNEAKFRALVQMSPDCIKLFDLDLKISYMNPAGLREHGLSSDDEISTLDFVSSIDVDHRERFERAFSNAKKGLSVSVLVKHVPDKSDRDWCHVSLAPIKGPDGEITNVLGVSRDISKVKDVEKTLNEKMIEVEKMNKLMIGREVKMADLKKQISDLKNTNPVADYKVIKTIYKND